MKFKSDIEVQAGIKDYSGSSGVSGQVLSSDGTTVSWIDAEIGVAGDVQNRVKAGVAINKGQAVYVTGADGTNIIVGLASNTTEATSSKTLGLLNATVATNGFADVIQIGKLSGLNTIGATVGDPVWLGTNGNLIYGLANKPYAPVHLVYIGVVTRVNASNGEIFVSVQNGFELKEIHDVDIITTTPINGDVLGYNGSLWVNKTIPGWLGYTPANDANVVHLTGTETITGSKIFTLPPYMDGNLYLKQITSWSNPTGYTVIGGRPNGFLLSASASQSALIGLGNLTQAWTYDFPNKSGTFAMTNDITGFVPYTGATSNVNLGSYSITANSFIKVGGNSTQYLKADGSVSTAMNSRVEVNFIATSGQTTFVTPYEVGQIDVYYNGSKLYPNEFTATNGTDVILATGATLNAQISIVKYVSSFSTAAVRNETTFTTTAGQTTFSVNYTPGQVDVFYNGSKLNISEFTATNGTSVVLGFACAAGESIVIDSYVNQVSGASGTTNYVSKFTGAASLGNSIIYDNGTNVGIGTTAPSYKFNVIGANPTDAGIVSNRLIGLRKENNTLAGYLALLGGDNGDNAKIIGYNSAGTQTFEINASTSATYFNGGNVGIGTASPTSPLHVKGSGSYAGVIVDNTGTTGGGYFAARQNGSQIGIVGVSGAIIGDTSSNMALFSETGKSVDFMTNGSATIKMRITSSGNVLIGTTTDVGVKLNVNGTSRISNTTPTQEFYSTGNGDVWGIVYAQASGTGSGASLVFSTKRDGNSATDKMIITQGGNVGIGTTSPINGGNAAKWITTEGTTNYSGGLVASINGSAKAYFYSQDNYAIVQGASGQGVKLMPNGVDGVTVSSGGNVGIGMSANSSRLTVNGTVTIGEFTNGTAYINANSGIAYFGNSDTAHTLGIYNNGNYYFTGSNVSDRRAKEKIVDLDFNATEKVMALQPKSYYMKNDSKQIRYGLIAQEVNEVLPDLICGDIEGDDFVGLDYNGVIPVLIKAIQELKAEIEILKNK